MARIRRDEEGNVIGFSSASDDADMDLYQQRYNAYLADPSSARTAGSARSISEGGVVSGGGETPLYRPGNWGSAGYQPEGQAVIRNGQTYYQIGSPLSKPELLNGTFQGRPYTDYVLDDPVSGTLMRADALKDAGRYNEYGWGDRMPGLVAALFTAGAASGLGAAGGYTVGASNAAGAGLGSLGAGAGVAAGGLSGELALGGAVPWTSSIPGFGTAAAGGASGLSGLLNTEALPSIMDAGVSAGAPGAANFASSFAPTITPGTVAGSELLGAFTQPVAGLSQEALLSGLGGAGAGVTQIGPAALTLDAAGNIINAGANLANTAAPLSAGLGSTVVGGAGAAANAPVGTIAKWLNETFKTNLTDTDLSSIARLGSAGLGVLGANQQSNAQSDLANKWLDLGAEYRTSLSDLNKNPSGFYNSPMVQGALQQGSDALARSLSAKVGNPILNPTALQEMQNYTTRGMLDQYNTRFGQLANAGQLGLGPAATFSGQAAAGAGNTYNAVGAGLQSVFGQDPMQQFGQALKQYPGLANIFRLT